MDYLKVDVLRTATYLAVFAGLLIKIYPPLKSDFVDVSLPHIPNLLTDIHHTTILQNYVLAVHIYPHPPTICKKTGKKYSIIFLLND